MRIALALSVLAACGSSSSPAPAATATFAGVPTTPPGQQLAWALDVIVNAHGAVDPAAVEAHFAPSFLAHVSADQTVTTFGQLAQKYPTIAIDSAEGDAHKLIAHGTSGRKKMIAIVEVDDATGKLSTLRIKPDAGPAPASYEEADKALAALAPHTGYLVASLDHGACTPLHAQGSTLELGIGSAFKLYVLLGLADRMIADTQRWTDEIPVRDAWKSLPAGITQDDAAGTKRTVQTLAERMISISDNTATDHLLYTMGRAAPEAALREAGHAKPELDTPFIGTRELFALKLGAPEDMARYIAMSADDKRAQLDGPLATAVPPLFAATAWKTARSIDKLEWFASSEDLCRVMATLWTRAQDPKAAPLLGVLAKNPGMQVDAKVWPYVGYKGGSEPGVIDVTYLLRRADDKWFVVTVTANANEGGDVSEDHVSAVAKGLVALAAAEK